MNGAYSLFILTITFLASSAVVYINMLCNEYQSECVCDCVYGSSENEYTIWIGQLL